MDEHYTIIFHSPIHRISVKFERIFREQFVRVLNLDEGIFAVFSVAKLCFDFRETSLSQRRSETFTLHVGKSMNHTFEDTHVMG